MSVLSLCVEQLNKLMQYRNLKYEDLQFEFIEQCINDKIGKQECEKLSLADSNEVEYRKFIKNLLTGDLGVDDVKSSIYSDLLKTIFEAEDNGEIIEVSDEDKNKLNLMFCEATARFIMLSMERRFVKENQATANDFLNTFKKVSFFDNSKDSDFIKSVTQTSTNIDEIMQDMIWLVDNYAVKIEKELSIEEAYPNADMMEVNAVVQDIMDAYESLYKPCYTSKPVGILTSEGILTLDESGNIKVIQSGINYMKRLYDKLQAELKGYLPKDTSRETISSDCFSNFKLVTSYTPIYHIYNIYGYTGDGKFETSWLKFSRNLKKEVTKKVASILDKASIALNDTIDLQKSIKDLFTNCIIVDEFDMTKNLKLNMFLGDVKFDANALSDLINREKVNIFSKNIGIELSCKTDSVGVIKYLYIFNEKAYDAEILFAYKSYGKLIESGVKPSSKNIVLGRSLDGEDILQNFDDAGNIVTSLIAGSRSGKGVMTLSILAGMIADGCPIAYLDFKPDMSATLWNLERDLNARGHDVKIFAIDSKENVRADDNAKPVRCFPYGLNKPSGVSIPDKAFSVVPYIKSIQLVGVLATLRCSYGFDKQQKFMLVLDEAQKLNTKYGSLYKELDKVANKNKKDNADIFDYCEKLKTILKEETLQNCSDIINTTGGLGRVSLFLIGQSSDPGDWGVESGRDWANWPFGNILAKSSYRILGANHGKSLQYSLTGTKYAGSQSMGKLGYFALHQGLVPQDNCVTMMKSYLVLNENDFNHRKYLNGEIEKDTFTGSLLARIEDNKVVDSIVNNDFLMEDGSLRESVGFAGLMKGIMGSGNEKQLAEKLGLGYKYLEDVYNLAGFNNKYSCLEEYLYDCSPDSIFTNAELETIVINTLKGNNNSNTGNVVDVFEDNKPKTSKVAENNNKLNLGVTQSNSVGFENIAMEDEENLNNNDSDNFINSDNDFLESNSDEEEFTSQKHVNESEYEQESFDTSNSNYRNSDNLGNRNHTSTIENQPRQSINTMSEPNEYKREFKVSQDMVNMFTKSGNNINKVYAINQLSSELIRLIDNDFGIDRVHSFEVVGDGYIRINDTLYKPFLPNVVIEMLPVDIQQFVKEGKVIELFNFKDLYRFKGLEILSIENPRLAEGRVRRELGMTPKHDWLYIFKKFRNLQKVIIAGQDISDTTTSDSYQNSYKQGFNLGESLVNKFFGGNKPKKNRDYSAINPLIHTGNGLASTMMKSRTCRVATKALGYTAGLKAVTVIASMLGPWGVLFGAMAVYGTVTQARKNGGLFADEGSQYANNNGGMGYTNPLYENDDYDDKPKSKGKSKGKHQQTRGKTNRD